MKNTSDIGVVEATAALKGMLGIGAGTEVPLPKEETVRQPKTAGKHGKKGKSDTPKRSTSKQRERTESSPRSNSNTKAPQNFAWSAFQASPDASALPIPAFAAPNVEESSARPEPNKLLALLSRSSGVQPENPLPIEIMNAPRAEDLEAQQIAEAEKAKQHSPKIITHPESESSPPTKSQEDQENSTSESGINIAAFASPHESTPSYSAPPHNLLDLPPPPTPFSSPQPLHRFPPHGNFNSPPPQPLHLPPPSYVTMQVQVPPILGPDRRIVVHSPAGYPVQIRVPDGVPPGMVLPVHVPAAPLIQSPYFTQQHAQPQPQGFGLSHAQRYGSPSIPYGSHPQSQQHRPPN